jgi:hypothetical protein
MFLHHPKFFHIETTHLLPCPQTIVLLEFALVVRHVVLAEDPAGDCQYRHLCGKSEVAVVAIAHRVSLRAMIRSCGIDVPCHCEEWRCIGGGVRVQWVVWLRVSGREVRSNDAAEERS